MTEEIIDYALPCMKAEQALKDAHNAFIENKLDLALTRTMDAIIDVRLMYAALRHAKETSTVYKDNKNA